jgi:tRNA pseudouridine55 synthase
MDNIFAVYKPKGISSFAMVALVRRTLGIKKVGHAGTLDPLAKGILVIGAGRDGTKQLATQVAKEKEYVAEIKLGEISTTDDAEGEKTVFNNTAIPNFEDVEKVVKKFIGEIMQVPPVFSAIKMAGKRAYKLARAGEEVEMKPRPALIKEIELLEYSYPIIKIRVVTGPGVYIRALARDIGKELGVGAYMSELERIRVGEFKINNCREFNN